MRSAFPFEERLLRGTSLLNRDSSQLEILRQRAQGTAFDDTQKATLTTLVDRLTALQMTLATPASLSARV